MQSHKHKIAASGITLYPTAMETFNLSPYLVSHEKQEHVSGLLFLSWKNILSYQGTLLLVLPNWMTNKQMYGMCLLEVIELATIVINLENMIYKLWIGLFGILILL